jgi:histidyl-tRNA synthetase
MPEKVLQAVRGMPDVVPAQVGPWQWFERLVRDTIQGYGYQEIRLPIIEPTQLFARSIGEVTDIVEKEMYTFIDRNEDSLTLRPEGTAGCVRAVIQHNLAITPQRLWYSGPMFRHERPQKGRLRQFQQVGAEVFGIATPDAEIELIALTARLWNLLGVSGSVRLELNSIGSVASRAQYKLALVAYLSERLDELDPDSQRRLHSNPLRILDSKNQDTQRVLDGAPVLSDYLDEASSSAFRELTEGLDALNIPYVINSRLVRGLDYYNDTVFEWTTTELGAQGTLCAGGRYDSLVGQLGGKPTPGVGFAMGVERILLLLEACATPIPKIEPLVFAVAAGKAAERACLTDIERLRSHFGSAQIVANLGGGSFRTQLKRADKSGAHLALIWGETEAAQGAVTVKYLRAEQAQQTVTYDQAVELLERIVINL